jgi:hypothetical protein
VALLNIFVGALEDGVLLNCLDSLLLLHAAKASLSIVLASGEINARSLGHSAGFSSGSSGVILLTALSVDRGGQDLIAGNKGHQGKKDKHLQEQISNPLGVAYVIATIFINIIGTLKCLFDSLLRK